MYIILCLDPIFLYMQFLFTFKLIFHALINKLYIPLAFCVLICFDPFKREVHLSLLGYYLLIFQGLVFFWESYINPRLE